MPSACGPKLIIADEPTSALDVVVQRQVMDTLLKVQEELGASILLIGHDMGLMAQVADRVGIMYAGEFAELSQSADLFRDPLHPYSQLLIKSLPSIEHKGTLKGIPGLPPSLLDRPPGCPIPAALPVRLRAMRGGRPALARSPAKPAGCVPSLLRRTSMTALMEIRHASKIFGGKTITGKQKPGTVALNDFTMTVHESPPTITAVVGESGSGKTTLVRLMLGLTSPTSGEVLYRGTDIRKLSKECAAPVPARRANDHAGSLRGL